MAGEAKIWDAETGQELLTLKGAQGGVAFSPDGKRLASGTKVWDAQTGQELLCLKGDAEPFRAWPTARTAHASPPASFYGKT